MTDRAVIALTAAIFVGENFVAFCLREDFSNDGCALEFASEADTGAFSDKKDVIKSDLGSGFTFEFLDGERFAGADAVLFTACFENCV